MKVGFTGTREGLTPAQGGALARLVRDLSVGEFHHGCCVGADAESLQHVRHHHPGVFVVGHPSNMAATTHRVALEQCHEARAPRPPLDRNRAIVDACDAIIACPKGMAEEQRSGTWATVRYARKQKKQIVIVWPDGTITEERKSG